MKLDELQSVEGRKLPEAACKQQAFEHACKVMGETDPAKLREISTELLKWVKNLGFDFDRLRLELRAELHGYAPYIDQLKKAELLVVHLAHKAWVEHAQQGRSFMGWLQCQRRDARDEQALERARAQRVDGELGRAKRKAEADLAEATLKLEKGRAERQVTSDLRKELTELRAQLAAQADGQLQAIQEARAQALSDQAAELARMRAELKNLRKEKGVMDFSGSEYEYEEGEDLATEA